MVSGRYLVSTLYVRAQEKKMRENTALHTLVVSFDYIKQNIFTTDIYYLYSRERTISTIMFIIIQSQI